MRGGGGWRRGGEQSGTSSGRWLVVEFNLFVPAAVTDGLWRAGAQRPAAATTHPPTHTHAPPPPSHTTTIPHAHTHHPSSTRGQGAAAGAQQPRWVVAARAHTPSAAPPSRGGQGGRMAHTFKGMLWAAARMVKLQDRPQGRSRCTPRGVGQAGARTRCGARGGVCRVPTPPHTRTHTRPAVVRRAAAQVARGGARTRPAMPHRGGGQGGRVGHRRSIRYYEGCCAVRHNVRPLQGESEPAVLVVADGAVGCAPTPPRSRGWDGRGGGGGREAPDPLPLPPDQHRHPTHPHKTPPQPNGQGVAAGAQQPRWLVPARTPSLPQCVGGGAGRVWGGHEREWAAVANNLPGRGERSLATAAATASAACGGRRCSGAWRGGAAA